MQSTNYSKNLQKHNRILFSNTWLLMKQISSGKYSGKSELKSKSELKCKAELNPTQGLAV